MALLVVGGHTRNIGKTSAVCAIVAGLPHLAFTAVKITQFGHGICSANGQPCDCETADHALALTEERDPATGSDTSRFLAAGARRSLWLRTRSGQLASAMPRIRAQLALARRAGHHVILESNSVLRLLRPDIFLTVLDPAVPDFKPSALRYLDRADAILLASPSAAPGTGGARGAESDPPPDLPALVRNWPGVSSSLLAAKPIFPISPASYAPPALLAFLSARLALLAPDALAPDPIAPDPIAIPEA